MSWLGRLGNTLRPARRRREIREEIEHHLMLRARDSHDHAFGTAEKIVERTHDMDILIWLESLLQDFRHAVRTLRRSPGFALVVVLSLALGIGANAAIFTVMDALVLRSLPVPNPQQLSELAWTNGKDTSTWFSYPLIQHMVQAAHGKADLGAYTPTAAMYIPDPGRPPRMIPGQLVSGGYFAAMGTKAELGRLILPSDVQGSGTAAVVISDRFWRNRLAASARSVGSHLQVNGLDCIIVGITTPGFLGFETDSPADAWLPLSLQPQLHYEHNYNSQANARGNQPWAPQDDIAWLNLVTRIPQASAQSKVLGMLRQILTGNATSDAQGLPWQMLARPGRSGASGLREAFVEPVYVLLAMAGVMLLIACANVAAMFVARNQARQRELAVRWALGISRARLARQCLAEGLILGGTAGVVGVAIARWGGAALARLTFSPSFETAMGAGLTGADVAFISAISMLAGGMVAFLPAWQARRTEAYRPLKRDRGSVGRLPFGRGLVMGQVALALLLVAVAGIFTRSLANLADQNPGFQSTHVLSLSVDMHAGGMAITQLPQIYRRLHDAVDAVPSVRSAAFAQCPIPSGCTNAGNVYFPSGGDTPFQSENYAVGQDYFATVGIPIIRGRGFEAGDSQQSPPVVVVNQAFADKFFSGRDAIGQRMGVNPAHASLAEIVGIVGNARIHNMGQPAKPQFYLSLRQRPDYVSILEVRTAGDPLAAADAIQHAIAAVSPDLPVTEVRSGRQLLQSSFSGELALARLSDLFGLLALALACIGLYGVIAFQVARRTGEFGLRLALGAQPARLLRSVVVEAVGLLVAGLAIGLPLAIAVGRLLRHQISGLLWGIGTVDPASLAVAVALLLLLPGLAALIPAVRAARVDPCEALRTE